MRTLIASFILSTTLSVPAVCQATLDNGALYQWESSNGTPTYSPDPPPKGTKYIVVGADLQPLAKQPALAPIPEPSAKTAATSIAVAPTPATPTQPPPAKWKPVRYANDPAIKATKTNRAPATITVEATAATIYESDECLALKREKLVLESQFARAKTDADMDNTILQLHEKSGEYKQRCTSQ